MTTKEIYGLDLIMEDKLRGIRKEKFKHNCHFSEEYEHELHTKESKQLNSLIDLTISQGQSLAIEIQELQNKMNEVIRELKRLAQNMDYIFDQNRAILTKNNLFNIEPVINAIKDLKVKLNIHD